MMEAHEKVRDEKGKKRKVKTSFKEEEIVEEADDDDDDEAEAAKGLKGGDSEVKSLKKVRMGTFEDSGLCKGFAFIDFITPQHATAALLDPRNYSMDGRALKLEFASADAVRRGGNGPRKPANPQGPRQPRVVQSRGEYPVVHSTSNNKVQADGEEEPAAKRPKKQSRDVHLRTDGPAGVRPRPGAALAAAQREKTGIVASEGKKIVF